jgi:hypothetical protein
VADRRRPLDTASRQASRRTDRDGRAAESASAHAGFAVMAGVTFNLQTVFVTLVESAALLCRADKASIFRLKGDICQHVAVYGFEPAYLEFMQAQFMQAQFMQAQFMQAHPMRLDRGSIGARAMVEGRTVHIHKIQADPEYKLIEAQKLGIFRTALGVPLPGSLTTPGRPCARDVAPGCIAFHHLHTVSVRIGNFRGSMAGLCIPLSTLRRGPRGQLRMTRGPMWIATPSLGTCAKQAKNSGSARYR